MSLKRLRVAADKLAWGMRVVGPLATSRGMIRMGALQLRRPPRARIRLACGPVLEFAYPGQYPPVLVLFGDVIDPEFAFLREIAHPGCTVVDVGAAIGQFTVFAAALLDAKVYAFEPSGFNIATLRANLDRNGVADQVSVHQVALSSSEGEGDFATAPTAFTSRLDTPSESSERVPIRLLSSMLEEIDVDHVDILKVNVAGFEPAVLEGAMPVLAAGRVDVLILLLGLSSLAWYARIATLGYRFFYYHPRRRSLHEVERFDEEAVLSHMPWPARHIIAVRAGAVSDGLVDGLTLEKAI